MKIAINAVSARQGGAVTYLQNMLPELQRQTGDASRIVVWRPRPATRTGDDTWTSGIEYRDEGALGVGAGAVTDNVAGRLWFDQVRLPHALWEEQFDALFSSANFGPLVTSTRHVILVRNAAYFDSVFMGRMRSAKVRAIFQLQRWLTLRCMSRADVVLFPTRAMMDLVAAAAGGRQPTWRVAPYGTRHELFEPDPGSSQRATTTPLRLLNVSTYSDQKDFGTLLRATELLDRRSPAQYHLTLTAGFHRDSLSRNPYHPRFDEERSLYGRLHAAGVAEDTNGQLYASMPALYRSAHVFVFTSYTESFGHPLVEAMASGLPIVAADMPCNRELCGDAALYFPVFDETACAGAVQRIGEDPTLAASLGAKAQQRSQDFTWPRHVEILIEAMRGE